jgi:antitoxin ParD1/3/4
MPTMNISLPEPLKQFIEEQVSAGNYSSVSEYVRELVRADQKRKAKQHLEDVLSEMLHSGEPRELTPEMWEELRTKIRLRAQDTAES